MSTGSRTRECGKAGGIRVFALRRLGSKIFLASALVVVTVLGGALLLTGNRAGRAADQSIDRALAGARAAIDDALGGRSRTLLQVAAGLVQVPNYLARITAAIDSRDRADLLDQADEFRDQTGAAWALITDADGIQQAWNYGPERGAFGDDLSESSIVGMALAWDSTEGVWIEPGPDGDVIFQAVGVPVFNPVRTVLYGVLVVALPIDSTFAFELKGRTNSDVVFFAIDSLGVPRVAVSTLPHESIDSAISRIEPDSVFGITEQSVHQRIPLAGETLIGVVGPMRTASGIAVGGYLGLRSRNVELAAFVQLRRTMIFAFVMGLGLALVSSLLIARQITRPVRQLVEVTRRVGEGHYSGTINVRSRDEIGQLASAFDRMLTQLREKEELVKYLRSELSLEQSIEAAAQDGAARAGTVRISHPTHALSVGMTLANRYEIRDLLGAGGMGVVYRAYDRELDEPVAIKVLKPEALLADSTMLERFKQEIRLARHITHRNVVRTHDLGEVDGMYYITMEYVEGTTLSDLIHRRGKLPVGVVLTIGKQLCRALEVAHEQGVIHRDIKPTNLVVDPSGFLKVMDFGVARLAERKRERDQITEPGAMIGTPEYMAPEMLLGEEIDARVDLYSAGAVLFECVTGRLVFSAPTVAALVVKHIRITPDDPRALNPRVPKGLAALILKALAKKREERWSSATEMYEALDVLRVEELHG